MHKQTPWGMSDYEEPIAPGVIFYGTPGHGGFHLDAKTNKRIPHIFRTEGGWYEEDCEWAIVAYFMPELFPAEQSAASESMIKNYYPDQWEAHTGKLLRPGESRQRDKQSFIIEHANDWVVVSAVGDWAKGVPENYVKVTATLGGRDEKYRMHGEDKHFLVPVWEYDARDGFGFIVDPSRHEEVT